MKFTIKKIQINLEKSSLADSFFVANKNVLYSHIFLTNFAKRKVYTMSLHNVYKEVAMKNENVNVVEQNYTALPEYGMQRIMHCANAYRSIAKTYLNFHKEVAQNGKETRQDQIYRKQAIENQNFMAEQFLYMADKLSEVASESYQFIPEEGKQYKQLARYLKKEGIEIKHVYYMNNENQDGVLEITMRVAENKGRIMTKEVADLLSIYYDMRLKNSVQSPYFVEEHFQSYTFVQEPGFLVISGEAAAVKNGEEISGDNILISEGVDGHIFFMLADGVGSGKEANIQSERVLEFMEKLLLAGYSKKTAISVLNGILLQDGKEVATSTLDICDLDLYKGMCEFHKIGGAVSFHKRERLVEKIWIDNLPLGAFYKVDLRPVRRKLQEGDYVIMITDGVIEEFESEEQEEALAEYISALTLQNPRDMAQHILQYCISLCKGNITDDLTVLVFGLWRN